MPDQANFNEVYQLSVDTEKFQQGLNELLKLYQTFLEQLGDQASNVIGVSIYQGIAEQLQVLSDEVAAFNQENQKTAQDAYTSVSEALTKIDAQEEDLSQKRAERAAKSAQDLANSPKDGSGNLTGTARDINIEAQALEFQRVRDQDEAYEKAHIEALTQDAQLTAEATAAQEKLNAARIRSVDESVERAHIEALAQDATMTEQAAAAQEKLNNSRLRGPDEAVEKAHIEALAQDVALTEQAAAAQDRLNAARIRPGEEIEAAQIAAIAENERRADEAGRTFLTTLGEQITTLAQFYLIWQAISVVIEGIVAVVSAPFKAFEEGFNYLAQTEQQAEKLAGVLENNVRFSADLADNFRLATEQANAVTVALQELSAKISVPVDQLQRTFSAIVDAGGASTVSTMRDLVTLTQDFALAFQAAGRSGTSLRSLVSQLPQLFEGNVKSTQAIAEALGVSGQRLTEIVASAKEHHDLVEQLQPLLSGLNAGADQLSKSYESQLATLKQQLHEIEAAGVAATFEQIQNILQQINEYVTKNKQEIEAWASALGLVASYLVGSVGDMANLATHSMDLRGNMEAVVLAFAVVAGYATVTLETILTGARVAADLAKLGVATSNVNPKAQASALADIVVDLSNTAQSVIRLAKLQQDLSAQLQVAGGHGPTDTRGQFDHPELDVPITDKGNRPDLSKPNTGQQEKEEFQNRLATIKEFYAAAVEQVKEGEAEFTTSRRDGATQIAALDEQEKAAIDQAVAAYSAQIQKKVTDTQKANELLKAADTERINLDKSINSTTSSAQVAGNKEGAEVDLINLKASLAQQKQALADEAAYENQLRQQGLQTESQALSQRQVEVLTAYENESNAIRDNLQKVASGTTEYARLMAERGQTDQKFTASYNLLEAQREAALTKEAAAARQHAATMEELSIQQQALEQQMQESASIVPVVSTAQYDAETKILAIRRQELELQLQINQARGVTPAQNAKILEQLKQITTQEEQAFQNQLKNIAGSGAPPEQGRQQQQSATQTELAKDELARDLLELANVFGVHTQEISDYNAKIANLTTVLAQYSPSIAQALQSMEQKFLGFDLGKLLGDANLSAFQKVGDVSKAVSDGLKNLNTAISAVQQGISQGGVLGGVGAGLGQLGSFLPGPAGDIVSGVGSVLSFIGGIFQAEAKHIADDIKKSFQDTVQAFQNGATSLVATITALQAQEAAAISQLSGKKGGKDQLDQLLPQFDNEIAQLKNQQTQIFTNFQQSLQQLQLQSDTLAQVEQQWQQINDQVTQYIGAGGDAAAAAQFLSLNLQKIQQTAQDSLNQGNQTAIQDALQLNTLLQQRIDLTTQYNEQVFQLTTQDSIERRQDSAVANGLQLAAIKQQYETDLDNLNSEISLTQQKVTLESQIFKLASDTATLNQQNNALTIAALQQQIKQWTDLKTIIGSVTLGAGGYTGSGVLNQIAQLTVQVTVTNPGSTNPATYGQQVGQSVAQELSRRLANGQPVG